MENKSKKFSKELKTDKLRKIDDVRNNVNLLEASLKVSRALENEQWLRCIVLKTRNKIMTDDLRKANKRNKNMLNLFRESVTDIRLGNNDILPDALKKEVQRIWHRKYDDLLASNARSKEQISTMEQIIKDKDKEVETLRNKLVEREEALKNICTKYLNLKRTKNHQENLPTPNKEAMLAREIRRSDRLSHENAVLRSLLRDAKRNCKKDKDKMPKKCSA